MKFHYQVVGCNNSISQLIYLETSLSLSIKKTEKIGSLEKFLI